MKFYSSKAFILSAILSLGLSSLVATQSSAEASLIKILNDDVKVQINGELVHFPDVQPYIDEDHRLQVPIRFVSDRLGFDVGWRAEGKAIQVTLKKDDYAIDLKTGEHLAVVNGEQVALASAAEHKRGRVFVPFRFLSETLGIQVHWDHKNQIAILNEDGGQHEPAWNAPEYTKIGEFMATAYSDAPHENGGWGPVDYFGNPLQLGTIAVDPAIIPLGSTLYITGYDFDSLPDGGMIATATDIGGSIKGNHIDIFIPEPHEKVKQFGKQNIEVYILKEE